ncbi:YjbE family putative metal transport protein [Salinicola rhizosphaerae]|uniref:Membrane protein n=1 Tax=Salinicola rhizosphaerae TaxID=1443141 RepID=A0ABQ3DWL5_9GAMM|nr:YjbE family putative metal transport protein [Salinicola rhizosphaerae]GHB16367.1 membrane protein [Salinicola rhizosphaerae]
MDLTSSSIFAFLGVILIDIVLSGDNAVIIGTIAAGLPDKQRDKAIAAGMAVAVIARILLSLIAAWLLTIPGLQVVGGLLLLYVARGMYKDIRGGDEEGASKAPRSFGRAMLAIILADLSMSLDNVLAVAGTATGHWAALMFGLLLSVAIMAFAAALVARLVEKHAWIAWVGLVFVLFVAVRMLVEGTPELMAMVQ